MVLIKRINSCNMRASASAFQLSPGVGVTSVALHQMA